jgi:hypothetical protein
VGHRNDDEPNEIENELGEVGACDCGGVHLSIGPMSLHVERDEVDALFELVCVAKELADEHRRQEAQRRGTKKKGRGGKSKILGTLH